MGSDRLRVYWGQGTLGEEVLRDTFIEQLIQLARSEFVGAPARRLTVEAVAEDESIRWRGYYKEVSGLRALLLQMQQERDFENQTRYLP